MRRDQHDAAFIDRLGAEFAVLNNLEDHITLELIKEFFVRVVMIIGAEVGSADDLDDKIVFWKSLKA